VSDAIAIAGSSAYHQPQPDLVGVAGSDGVCGVFGGLSNDDDDAPSLSEVTLARSLTGGLRGGALTQSISQTGTNDVPSR
jgi:hypothetical protein